MRDVLLLAGSTVTILSQATGQRVAWSLAGLSESLLRRRCSSGFRAPPPQMEAWTSIPKDIPLLGKSQPRGSQQPPSPGGIVEGTRKGTDVGSGLDWCLRSALTNSPPGGVTSLCTPVSSSIKRGHTATHLTEPTAGRGGRVCTPLTPRHPCSCRGWQARVALEVETGERKTPGQKAEVPSRSPCTPL